MSFHKWILLSAAAALPAVVAWTLQSENRPPSQTLANTELLTSQGDLAAPMVAGIDRFLTRRLETSPGRRGRHWNRDFSSFQAYLASVAENRKRFSTIIGVVDDRVPPSMDLVATTSQPALVGTGIGYDIFAVRWQTLKGVDGTGLLLEPKEQVVANVVALPDGDWTPEMLIGLTPGLPPRQQFARRLAENQCRVLVPLLMDRRSTYSGDPSLGLTNQPHREFIYRAAFEMGRHVIGYEVQKVLSAVDWFRNGSGGEQRPVGVIGYGEGGLIGFYAAALDRRIDAVAVSGYFGSRERLWQEPIYRNVWGLLREFGDAEIASLVVPRPLVVEDTEHPQIPGPPPESPDRKGAAPGFLRTPSHQSIREEVSRAHSLISGLDPAPELRLIESAYPGSDDTLTALLVNLGIEKRLRPLGQPPRDLRKGFDPELRLKKQFDQLLEHTQVLMREAPARREEFWSNANDSSGGTWETSSESYRQYLWDELIGRLPPASLPARPRTRLIYDQPNYRGYEVVLDIYPDVFAYGILLVPKDIQSGERRPVVVCQHGLEGRSQDVADPNLDHPAYHRFACRLADRGFVTYAPQNPYIGRDSFRVLQRMANPLKKSLFSFIVRQHERTIEWLAEQPFVDPQRIALYGLSYGGKTAMRVPALLPGYCLSICSADYNQWIWKNVSAHDRFSYLFTAEYEMPEFNLGNTFNYAELSWLILPRPFMVERGHGDGVAPDEWVAYEYARTRRRYELFGIGDRTRIEFFNGPHTIHGVGTFEFLHRHLNWPQ